MSHKESQQEVRSPNSTTLGWDLAAFVTQVRKGSSNIEISLSFTPKGSIQKEKPGQIWVFFLGGGELQIRLGFSF